AKTPLRGRYPTHTPTASYGTRNEHGLARHDIDERSAKSTDEKLDARRSPMRWRSRPRSARRNPKRAPGVAADFGATASGAELRRCNRFGLLPVTLRATGGGGGWRGKWLARRRS